MTSIEYMVVLALGCVATSGAKCGVSDLGKKGKRKTHLTTCIAVDDAGSILAPACYLL